MLTLVSLVTSLPEDLQKLTTSQIGWVVQKISLNPRVLHLAHRRINQDIEMFCCSLVLCRFLTSFVSGLLLGSVKFLLSPPRLRMSSHLNWHVANIVPHSGKHIYMFVKWPTNTTYPTAVGYFQPKRQHVRRKYPWFLKRSNRSLKKEPTSGKSCSKTINFLGLEN